LNTKLILLEGLPGSGKTTTARNLAAELNRAGTACQVFWEWSDPHPIDIGDFDHVGEYIATISAREQDLIRQWRKFALHQRDQETVTVMESRFWQTTAMLMVAGGCPAEDVIQHNQGVIAAIRDLQPVLIYFTTGDVRAAMERTIRIKNDEWQGEGREISWAEQIYKFLKPQQWFANRNPHDLHDMIPFFEEWSVLAERLFAGTPFPKIKIRDPYLDWDQTMREIRAFLELPQA
jgi:thymidylate kinase